MIKKILDWILGKNDSGSQSTVQEAPYKVEAPVVEQPAPVAEVVQEKPVVETAAVTVKAKYKKAELEKMTKAQLVELATKHGLELKARAPKADLVKALTKV